MQKFKQHNGKGSIRRGLALFMAGAMMVTQLPATNLTVAEAADSEKIYTSIALGVGNLHNPSESGGDWSIVNYGGQYFRVLDPDSTDYGVSGGSVLLDSDGVYGYNQMKDLPNTRPKYPDRYATDYISQDPVWTGYEFSLSDSGNPFDIILNENEHLYYDGSSQTGTSYTANDPYAARYGNDKGSLTNTWSQNSLYEYLNTSGEIDQDMTSKERGAIVRSKKQAKASGETSPKGMSYAPLKGERFFVLDGAEATNPAYGYGGDESYRSKRGNSNNLSYWLRSPGGDGEAGVVTQSGALAVEDVTSRSVGFSPAFNIKKSSILFTELGEDNDYEALYGEDGVATLTLLDSSVTFEPSTESYNLERTDEGVKLSFTGEIPSGYDRVSLLVTAGEYTDDDAEIIQYDECKDLGENKYEVVLDDFGSDDWDDYSVYVFAEDINQQEQSYDRYIGKYTDIATVPVETPNLRVADYEVSATTEADRETFKYDGKPHMNTIESVSPKIEEGEKSPWRLYIDRTEEMGDPCVDKKNKYGKWDSYSKLEPEYQHGISDIGIKDAGIYRVEYEVDFDEYWRPESDDSTIYLPPAEIPNVVAYFEIKADETAPTITLADSTTGEERDTWEYGQEGSQVQITAPAGAVDLTSGELIVADELLNHFECAKIDPETKKETTVPIEDVLNVEVTQPTQDEEPYTATITVKGRTVNEQGQITDLGLDNGNYTLTLKYGEDAKGNYPENKGVSCNFTISPNESEVFVENAPTATVTYGDTLAEAKWNQLVDGDILYVTGDDQADNYKTWYLSGDTVYAKNDTIDPETYVPTYKEDNGNTFSAVFTSTGMKEKDNDQADLTPAEENFTKTFDATLTVNPYPAKFVYKKEGEVVKEDKLPKVKENLTYTGKAQELATAGTLDDNGKKALENNCGTAMYAVTTTDEEPDADAEDVWTTTVPKATEAGTYYVWSKIVGDEDGNVCGTVEQAKATADPDDTGVSQVGEVVIAQATNKVTAPKAKDLTYTGGAQALVTAGSSTYGKLQYAVNKNESKAPTSGWKDSVPTETYAGTYYVWYKVDETVNYEGAAPECVPVTIKEKKVSLYRLYNPNSGEHFYTTSKAEKDNLAKVGWNYEGEAGKVPATGTNVYRVYNPNAGDHHYTQSKAEKDSLVKLGWKDEGVAFKTGGDKAMLRLYNPNATGAGAHHYTQSVAEKNSLVKAGWRYEGTGWNVY